ncbi:hypothetical protein AB205_0098820, partial [Aquarana catesbeiana]
NIYRATKLILFVTSLSVLFLIVCDVLPLIINNLDVRLPASLLYKYLNKAAEFYINYMTRSPQNDSQQQGWNPFFLFPFPPKVFEKLTYNDLFHRVKELCRYISNFDNEAHAKYKNQVGGLCISLNVHIRFVNSQSSDDEELSGKSRSRHVVVNKNDLSNPNEVLESFKMARECWDLLHSSDALDKEFSRICLPWKTDTWLWLRIFLTDMVIYQGQHKKAINSLHLMAALQGPHSPSQQIMSQGSLEQQRSLIQLAACHFALGEYKLTCEKVLELMNFIVPPPQETSKHREEQSKVKPKFRKGSDLKLLPCVSKYVMPYCLQLLLASVKLRALSDNRDDMALGQLIVLLQHDWPKGEILFLKTIGKICQQGNFQYENFFNYITNIDMLEEFAYLRTQEGGKIHLELIPNQGVLLK